MALLCKEAGLTHGFCTLLHAKELSSMAALSRVRIGRRQGIQMTQTAKEKSLVLRVARVGRVGEKRPLLGE